MRENLRWCRTANARVMYTRRVMLMIAVGNLYEVVAFHFGSHLARLLCHRCRRHLLDGVRYGCMLYL